MAIVSIIIGADLFAYAITSPNFELIYQFLFENYKDWLIQIEVV